MIKWVALGASAIVLSGCTMPVPFQIASWALDGISVLATQKSVTDHGISLVAQQDCAVWRGVTEGELCREAGQSDVMVAEEAVKTPASVASLQTPATANRRNVAVSTSPVSPELSLRAPVQVRAVPTHALRAAWAENERTSEPVSQAAAVPGTHAFRASSSPVVKAAEMSGPAPKAVPVVKVETVKSKPFSNPDAKPAAKSVVVAARTHAMPAPQRKPLRVAENVPSKGIYFVIGSFRNPDNARRLTVSNARLSPHVLSARLDGTDVYRVVVGPVPRGKEKRLHRALARDGFPDTWAIRVNPSDWQFAKIPGLNDVPAPEIAALRK